MQDLLQWIRFIQEAVHSFIENSKCNLILSRMLPREVRKFVKRGEIGYLMIYILVYTNYLDSQNTHINVI